MRGNSYTSNAVLPQAANDPGQPPAPQRRVIPPPINDNRLPFWQRRLVRLAMIVAPLAAAAWYFLPFTSG